MTSDCLFTFGFSPNLPVLGQKLFCFDVQNNFWRKTGKFGEKHIIRQTIACHVLALIEENMELSHIHLAVILPKVSF
jgi:hypothetical protein